MLNVIIVSSIWKPCVCSKCGCSFPSCHVALSHEQSPHLIFLLIVAMISLNLSFCSPKKDLQNVAHQAYSKSAVLSNYAAWLQNSFFFIEHRSDGEDPTQQLFQIMVISDRVSYRVEVKLPIQIA